MSPNIQTVQRVTRMQLLTHFSTGRGFPLWKLVRISAIVVRVLPWKTKIQLYVLTTATKLLGPIKKNARIQMINLMCSDMWIIARDPHQSHVICQDPTSDPLWYFFSRKTREGVVVQLASFLPERRQRVFVFPSVHPGQSLFLVRKEGGGHSLQGQKEKK